MELIFILLMIVALALYRIGKKTTYVACVEAGDTNCVKPDDLKVMSHREKYQAVLDAKGHLIPAKDYIKVVVKGNCLEPKGIVNGSELLVYKFKNDTEKKDIKAGDILMIHLESKGIDKIRVFEKMREDGLMDTYRFDENKNIKMSSRPHDLNSVVGKVKYLL